MIPKLRMIHRRAEKILDGFLVSRQEKELAKQHLKMCAAMEKLFEQRNRYAAALRTEGNARTVDFNLKQQDRDIEEILS